MSPSPGTLTTAGMILGTPKNMSPEQARGLPVDKRTDIWAFGCCLFEALTGEIPFGGSTVMDILSSVLEHTPIWDKLPGRKPRQLDRVIRRCLEKDREDRLHDIADARMDLKEALDDPDYGSGEAAGAYTPNRLRTATVLLSGIVIGSLLVFGVLRPSLNSPAKEQRQVFRFDVPVPDMRQAGNPNSMFSPSPDGEHLVYAGNDDSGQQMLFLHNFELDTDVVLPGTEDGWQPFFSPNGKWIAFYNSDRLMKVSLLGGAPIELAKASDRPRGGAWGSDGTIVFTLSDHDFLYRISETGGDVTQLTKETGESASHRWPQFLPDGKNVLFTNPDSVGGANDVLHVVSLETGEIKEILRGGFYGRYVSSGHLCYAIAGTLMAVPFDLERLEIVGTPTPVLNDLRTIGEFHFASYEVSKDGLLTYLSGSAEGASNGLVWINHEGQEEKLNAALARYRYPAVSPDGTRIAVSIYEDIYILDLIREASSTFTFEGNVNEGGTWSADGKEILFASQGRGDSSGDRLILYRKPADGSGSAIEIPTPAIADLLPWSISVDGNTLYVYTKVAADFDLWEVSLDGEHESKVLLKTRFREGRNKISPDGKWMAYSSDESGRHEVYVRRYPEMSGKWQVSIGGGSYPLWAPDMSEIYYRSSSSVMAVEIDLSESFEAGQPHALFDDTYYDASGFQYDLSPDGERFLMIKTYGDEGDDGNRPIKVVTNWFEELKRLVPVEGN